MGAQAGEALAPGHVPPGWPAPLRGLAALSRGLAVLEGAGICFCLIGVIGLATWQFVAYNVTQNLHSGLAESALFHVPAWTDNVIRHSVFLLGFLGGAYATHTGRHFRIDSVPRMLRPRPRAGLRILTTLLATAIVLAFARFSWEAYQGELANQSSGQEELITSARGFLIMVIGYAAIAFHFVVQIAIDLGWLISGDEPPSESEAP